MRSLRIAYNERQEPLEVLLRTVDRPGDYCMHGRLLAPMPRVEVEGGALALLSDHRGAGGFAGGGGGAGAIRQG